MDVSPKQRVSSVSSVAENSGVVLTQIIWSISLVLLHPSGKTEVLVSHIFRLAM